MPGCGGYASLLSARRNFRIAHGRPGLVGRGVGDGASDENFRGAKLMGRSMAVAGAFSRHGYNGAKAVDVWWGPQGALPWLPQ